MIMTEFEHGSRTDCGSIAVLNLHGSWYDMGRQYGHLLSGELRDVYDFVRRIADAGENRAVVRDITARLDRQHPYFLRRFFDGMAETSGLTAEQLLMVDGVERIAGLPACSAIAVNGSYTENGRLVFGRNYDYGEIFTALKNDLAVTVFHPADGSLAAAIVGYAGEIYCVNGLNEKGLFLELNNAMPSSPDTDDTRVYATTMLLMAMLQADTMERMDQFFHTVQTDYAYIISVADAACARSYEWDIYGVHTGDCTDADGLLIATNHYISLAWPYPVPANENCWDSLTRRQNLTALCRRDAGRLDAGCMMNILDTHLKNGGATDELTVYQMVVTPDDLTMWVKAVGATDWVKLDMAQWLRE